MAALVTNAGKAIIAGRLYGATPTQAEPKYLQWGTSNTAEAVTQTALQAPSAEGLVACTVSQVTTNVANDSARWTGTITSVSTQTIQELGLFDAVSSGNMFLRGVIAAQALQATDSITATITHTSQ